MENAFFERPIVNSPYLLPERHWELDKEGQPTQKIIEERRKAEFTDIYEIAADFSTKVEPRFNQIIEEVIKCD